MTENLVKLLSEGKTYLWALRHCQIRGLTAEKIEEIKDALAVDGIDLSTLAVLRQLENSIARGPYPPDGTDARSSAAHSRARPSLASGTRQSSDSPSAWGAGRPTCAAGSGSPASPTVPSQPGRSPNSLPGRTTPRWSSTRRDWLSPRTPGPRNPVFVPVFRSVTPLSGPYHHLIACMHAISTLGLRVLILR